VKIHAQNYTLFIKSKNNQPFNPLKLLMKALFLLKNKKKIYFLNKTFAYLKVLYDICDRKSRQYDSFIRLINHKRTNYEQETIYTIHSVAFLYRCFSIAFPRSAQASMVSY